MSSASSLKAQKYMVSLKMQKTSNRKREIYLVLMILQLRHVNHIPVMTKSFYSFVYEQVVSFSCSSKLCLQKYEKIME